MTIPTRLETVFFGALEAGSPDKRCAYLAQVCGDDPELRRQVEDLLAANRGVRDFLEVPAAELSGVPLRVAEKSGATIGPYRLLQPIGEGGMGVVYAAEQSEPVQRKVALKIIKPGMDTKQVIARFAVEMQALAVMDHPNIAKVFDTGATVSGRPYFVMELVAGVPISKYCDQHQLNPRERLELFFAVCNAVQHAHQKGIIHRDLKPTNILVAEYDGLPVPKVIDFGVAKATGRTLGDNTTCTQLGQIVGTIEYMSPEQIELNPIDIDTRSDIYSLGVLLYELLTGTTPFEKNQLYEAGLDEMRRIIREHQPPLPSARVSTLNAEALSTISGQRRAEPRQLGQAIRGELDWIVMKSLEKDRSRRYETASALAADVGRYLRNEPIEARSPSSWYRCTKWLQRNRTTAVTVLLVAMALALSSCFAAWQAVRATRASNEARAMRSVAVAVNEFLTDDLLAQADPNSQPDRDIPLRTILDRTAQNVEGRFPTEPRVAAAIRLTLGKTYCGLGEYHEAEMHFDKAVDLYRDTVGAQHRESLAAKRELGRLHLLQGRFEPAERTLRHVLSARLTTLGESHLDTAQSMHDLGDVCTASGHYDAAERLYFEAGQVRQGKLGPLAPGTLAAQQSLARVYRLQERHDEAAAILAGLCRTLDQAYGSDHPERLRVEIELAAAYLDQRRLPEAERLAARVADVGRRVWGPEHPDTIAAMCHAAVASGGQGRRAEAAQQLEDVIRVTRKTLSERHPLCLLAKIKLGQVYVQQQRHGEAEPLFKQVVDSQPTRQHGIEAMRGLAEIYAARGEMKEANEWRQNSERAEFFFGLEERIIPAWRRSPFNYSAEASDTGTPAGDQEGGSSLPADGEAAL